MSETKESKIQDRNSPIPAEKAGSARPWRLPFWTDEPAYAVEKEEPEENATDAEAVQSEPPRKISPPTAEELEKIRREAYNDGLEQGLVEGRQQGVQAGREEGIEEGRKQGYDIGLAEGKDAGNRIGYDEGRARAQEELAAHTERLNRIATVLLQGVAERDAELPQVMVNLLSGLAATVLGHELSVSDQAIQRYVEAAIESLPGGEKALRIFISQDDSELIQQVSEQGIDWPPLAVDKRLRVGECRVESEHSRVEYSAREHLQHTLESLAARMLASAEHFPDDEELALVEVVPEEACSEEACSEEARSEEESSAQSESDEPETENNHQSDIDSNPDTQPAEAEQAEPGEDDVTSEATLNAQSSDAASEDEMDDGVIPSPPSETEKPLQYAFDNRPGSERPENAQPQNAHSVDPQQPTDTRVNRDDSEPTLG